MEEETVTCPSCGREVPKTLYCIYCGTGLFEAEVTQKTIETETVEEEKVEEDVEEIDIEVEDISKESTEELYRVEVEPAIQTLMDDLQKNFIWKIKLISVLSTGDISEAVFTKLFDEYQSKLNNLIQLKNQKIEHFRDGLDQKKEEYKEAKIKLEELKVRCMVGEIDKTEMEHNAPELEKKIDTLATETSYVDIQLDRLNNLLWGKTPKEIMELERTAIQGHEALKTLMDRARARALSNDLEAALKIFDSIIGEKKKEEEELMEKLSALETRYKIGEISISDFEKSKQETQLKLEKIWE